MKLSKLALGVLLPLLGAGCTSSNLSLPGTHLGGQAQIQVMPRVQAGGYHVQDEVSAYTSSDVKHLVVKLFTVSGSSETAVEDLGVPVQKDVLPAAFNTPIVFSNLHHDTKYRIRAYAYADEETSVLISTEDASSAVDVDVTNDDRPALTSLPVQLIDRVFNGQATSSAIVVTGGDVLDAGTETIQ